MEIDSILFDLHEVFKECSVGGWDGESSQPISEEVFRRTRDFINWLYLSSFFLNDKKDMKNPDIGAEPDGSITLEWYNSPDEVMSLSVCPDGYIYWAELICGEGRRGKF